MTVLRLVDRDGITKATDAEVTIEVQRSRAFARLRAFGFTREQAMELARADMTVVFIPAAAVGL